MFQVEINKAPAIFYILHIDANPCNGDQNDNVFLENVAWGKGRDSPHFFMKL